MTPPPADPAPTAGSDRPPDATHPADSARPAGVAGLAGAGRSGVRGVAWGLLAAWVVHDLEELATMPSFSHQPDLPRPLARLLPMSRTEATTAIALTGVAMAAASAAGAATGGRSRLFQAALAGFGLHAGTHLAQSAVLRCYTPGLITTPLVVIPYSIWAWRRLKANGIPVAPTDRRLNLALAAIVPLSHAIARLPRLRRR